MGGKNASGPGMGMGGAGKGRGGGGMTAEQADAANQTRRQNIFTTVGGMSNPGAARASVPKAGGKAAGGLTSPPNPRVRPTGPSGPGTPPGTMVNGVPVPPPRPPGSGLASGIGPGTRSLSPAAYSTALPSEIDPMATFNPNSGSMDGPGLADVFAKPATAAPMAKTIPMSPQEFSAMTPAQWAAYQARRKTKPTAEELPVASGLRF